MLASNSTAWGGPPVVVRDLAAALSRKGVDNTVVALAGSASATVPFPPPIRCRFSPGAYMPRLGIPASPMIATDVLRSVHEADVVHLHELWHIPEILGGVSARAFGRPYLISPHGALSPWIARQRKTSKRVAWAVVQRRIVDSASGIHAVTPQESDDVRSVGVEIPVKVIPNGIDVESIHAVIEGLRGTGPRLQGRYVLFLGRLDPKKGLDVLVKGFAQVSRQWPDLRLVLAGPDTQGMWPGLRGMAASLGIADRVSYLGVVDASTKARLLAEALLFALPSRSEGMSIALLEALASGLPAIVSPQCNLPEIESARAGRVVESTPSQLADAISTLLDDEALRRAMAHNAEELARARFSIDRMATEMLTFYEETLAGIS